MTDPYYQSRFTFDARRDEVWKEICRYLQRYIPEDSQVLELGAGYCHFINHVRARGKSAVDLSPDGLRRAAEGVRTYAGSCTDLHFLPAESMDVVFASNLLEHLERPDTLKTLSEVRRVLKKGGRLILIQPNFKYCAKEYFDDYTHVQIFTHLGLQDLLKSCGFEIAAVQPRFLPFSMQSRVPKAPFLVRLYLHSPVKPFAGQMLVVAQSAEREG